MPGQLKGTYSNPKQTWRGIAAVNSWEPWTSVARGNRYFIGRKVRGSCSWHCHITHTEVGKYK